MKAMVLAAGLGTRLGPYSEHVPKPLFPVLGIAAIDWVLASLAKAGVDSCVINVHHCPMELRRHLGKGLARGMKITVSEEPDILGTGGGLAEVAEFFENEQAFLVHNGDVFSDWDLSLLVDRISKGDVVGVMALAEDDQRPEAKLVEAHDGLVVGIRGKPASLGGPRYVFSGISAWTPQMLEILPRDRQACLVADGVMKMLDDGCHVAAIKMDGLFCDIGTPQRFLDLQWELFDKAVVLFKDLGFGLLRRYRGNVLVHGDFEMGPGVGFDGPVLVADRVVIGSGARIGPRVVLSKGVRVAPGTRIKDAVVFPGAEVSGDVTGIVTGR